MCVSKKPCESSDPPCLACGAHVALCDSARLDVHSGVPIASALPGVGGLLEIQTLRPHPDLLNQDLHFNKLPRGFWRKIQFEKHWNCLHSHPTQQIWGQCQLNFNLHRLVQQLHHIQHDFLLFSCCSEAPLPTQMWEKLLECLTVSFVSSSRLPFPVLVILASCLAIVKEDVITCLEACLS